MSGARIGKLAPSCTIHQALPRAFKLDAELIKVLVMSRDQLEGVVKKQAQALR
jgi:hypothetical protein